MPYQYQPNFLWSENPLADPDRELIKDQRLYYVDNPSITPFWPAPEVANGTAVEAMSAWRWILRVMISRWLNERGIAALVVKYRMQEYGFPAPLLDGLRAVRTLRAKAAEWKLDPQKIGVMGFAAGGHLAASVTTRSDFTSPALGNDPLRGISARPDFAILGYPVITLEGTDAHKGSRTALLGAVPVANSLMFFNEVQKFNKKSELHVYQTDIHGFGMRQGQGPVSSWPQALELWLRHNGYL